ncbi:MAG: uracil-DNA glycosylase family protein [Gaiellales bacterium]
MAESDEIYERYLARAIKAMNALGDEIAERDDPGDPAGAPVLGSGHPLADIMLLKARPQAAEIQEGVAFFGRAGSAILKSITRVGIDPLTIYGTNCAKRPDDDLEDGKGPAARFLLREIQITEPKIIVCMGADTAAFVNRIKVPLAESIDPELLGEVQQLTPTIEALVTPDIDESLDEESSKRRFWKAFQELGRWYSALPPY